MKKNFHMPQQIWLIPSNKNNGWSDAVTNCSEHWTKTELIKFPNSASQITLQKIFRNMIQKCSGL